MDVILTIRQMIAESKYFEAQNLIEHTFLGNDPILRGQLTPLYLDTIISQNKQPPSLLLIEVAEKCLATDTNKAETLIQMVPKKDIDRCFLKIQKIKMHIADKKGKNEELYSYIFATQIFLFSKKIPVLLAVVESFIKKYFSRDFKLLLQKLSLEIMSNNYAGAEKNVKGLILSCFEQSSTRAVLEKIGHIEQILKTCKVSCSLDVYRNLCSLITSGIKTKMDYKRLAECIIYFDDSKFQAIILNLICELGLTETAKAYAKTIKENKEYDFVYFDKYFSHLKPYFVELEIKTPKGPETSLLSPTDLKLEKNTKVLQRENQIIDDLADEETHFINLLTYQEYSFGDLLEIATSFLQSRMPKAALKATELALSFAHNDQSFLKVSYLKIMSLIHLQDYRAALDLCLEAIERSINHEDKLSFQYMEADIYMKLGNYKAAKEILGHIYSIDSNYRLTKERLQKLNEI